MHDYFSLNSTERRQCSREDHILLMCPQNKNARLIGEKCLIKVLLNNKLYSVLLNIDAQVSVISDKYLGENIPHVDEYPVNELLDETDFLRVQW